MGLKDILNALGGGLFKQAKDLVSELVVDKDKRNELIQKMDQAEKDLTTKLIELEDQDRASARTREVEIAKTGKKDWMMWVVGVIGMGSYVTVILAALFVDVKDKEIFYFLAGNVFGVSAAIFTYYFGTSKGSADKSDAIHTLLKNRSTGA